MSEFHIQVVRIGAVEKHPNADTLSITRVHGGYPCVIRTGDFQSDDLAVYIPVDSSLPETDQFSFLRDSERARLRAKRLRGIFSMGLLVKAPEDAQEGDDVQELLGITKWEPSLNITMGECEAPPQGWFFPTYTDLEGLRRWPSVLQAGEEVVLTEKIHGCNARFVHDGERLWCGSRTRIKKDSENSLWWVAARHAGLEEKLAQFPMMIFFGEVYGKVQDLRYGHENNDKPSFSVFDVFSVKDGSYLDHDHAVEMVRQAGLSWVPCLYRGEWKADLMDHAEGQSCLAKNVREGFVVKPVKERFSDIGRVILKLHGQGYLLRK